MIKHKSLISREKKLKIIFDSIDDYLEEKYGKLYPLHPRRSKRGSTSNKEHDGLFNIGASYSLGIGSSYGAGYVIEVRLLTLKAVPQKIREQIEEEVVILIKAELLKVFPEKNLKVDRDGSIYKIYGDLSLGRL